MSDIGEEIVNDKMRERDSGNAIRGALTACFKRHTHGDSVHGMAAVAAAVLEVSPMIQKHEAEYHPRKPRSNEEILGYIQRQFSTYSKKLTVVRGEPDPFEGDHKGGHDGPMSVGGCVPA